MSCRFCIPIVIAAALTVGGWKFFSPCCATNAAFAQTSDSKDGFPAEWYFNGRSAKLKGLEGKAAPALLVKNWIGDEQNLKTLKGKVVVVDFWATWCRPCVQSIPKNNQLVEKYGEKGLVFIGVHESKRGSDRMAKMAKEQKINYPLCVDDASKSVKAYGVSFFPTYVVIDHKGVVRAAGLMPHHVESVVKKLLDEMPQEAPPKKGAA